MKAQEIAHKNVTPTDCLGGGYDLLERKIMEEKTKNSSSNDVLSPPSPPSRHEK